MLFEIYIEVQISSPRVDSMAVNLKTDLCYKCHAFHLWLGSHDQAAFRFQKCIILKVEETHLLTHHATL